MCHLRAMPGDPAYDPAKGIPWLDQEEVIAELDRNIKALASTDDWMREHPPELKAPVIQEWPAAKVPKDHEGIKVLADSYRAATRKEAVISAFRAICDATFLCDAGVPAVVMGPGISEWGSTESTSTFPSMR